MLYSPPTGSTDPNAPYEGVDYAAGKQGSKVPKAAIEAPQRELVNLIDEAGLTRSGTDLAQVLKAIRSGALHTFVDAGSANHIVIKPRTPYLGHPRGQQFRIFPAARNTGAVDIAIGDLATVAVRRRDGSALQGGDLLPLVPVDIVADGVAGYRLMNLGYGEVPRIIPEPTLYVRYDAQPGGDGSSNDVAHAFQTIAQAAAAAASLFLTGRTLTIQLGVPGAYAAPGYLAQVVGGLLVRGDPSQPSAYVIEGVGSGGQNGFVIGGVSQLSLDGVTVSNTGSTNNTFGGVGSTALSVRNTLFRATGNNTTRAHIAAFPGVTVSVNEGCDFSGSMGQMWNVLGGALTMFSPVSLSGTPNFADATVRANSLGQIITQSGVSFTGSGATGRRYAMNLVGVIASQGGGENFFPGNQAGAKDGSSIYA